MKKSILILSLLFSSYPAYPESAALNLGLSNPGFSFKEISPGLGLRVNEITVQETASLNEWAVTADSDNHDLFMFDLSYYLADEAYIGADFSIGTDFSEFLHTRLEGYMGPYFSFLNDRIGFGPLLGVYYNYLGNSLLVLGSAISKDAGEKNKLYLVRDQGTDYLHTLGPHMFGSHGGLVFRVRPVKFLELSLIYLAMLAEAPVADLEKINTTSGGKRNALAGRTVADTRGELARFSFLITLHVSEFIDDFPSIYLGSRQIRHPSIGLKSTAFVAGVSFEYD